MKPAVGGQQAELNPALVNMGRSGRFESGNIMAPEPEAAVAHGKARPQGFRHGDIGSAVVAAPVHRELLTTRGGTAGEENRFSLPADFPDRFKDHLVVQEGEIVVHVQGAGSVEIRDILHGDPFAEVGLQTVDAHGQQLFQVAAVPFPGLGIGYIHNPHAGLPQICLPDIAVGLFDEITILRALREQGGLLGNVGIDPAAELQTPVMIALQHAFRIREGFRIPFEVAPVIAPHPETVKMEHGQGNIPLGHAVDKAAGGFLVIIRGKGGGQPQAEAPCRQDRRTSGQRGIEIQNALRGFTIDHIVDQRFPFHGKLGPLHLFAGNLKADIGGILHEDAVAPVCHVEGDVLISQLGGRSAVSVPHIHALSVFDIGREPFAKAVHALSDVQHQAVAHVRFAGVAVQRMGHGPEAGGGEHLSVPAQEIHLPAALRLQHLCGQSATGEAGRFLAFGDRRIHIFLKGGEMGRPVLFPGKMGDPDADDILPGRGEFDFQDCSVQGFPAAADRPCGRQHFQRPVLLFHPDALGRIVHGEVFPGHPVSSGKFQIVHSSFIQPGFFGMMRALPASSSKIPLPVMGKRTGGQGCRLTPSRRPG